MTPAREAVQLPILFLTVLLLGAIQIADRVALQPPSLFGLVLGVVFLGLLVRSGALAPERLMHTTRPRLANLNGVTVVVSATLAAAQAFTLVTPDFGLPRVLVSLFLLILLLTTLAASPDRRHVLRGLLVILGTTFTLKFVVLAALSGTADGRLARVLQILFEGVTLGAVSQEVIHPATSYLAFATLVLFLVVRYVLKVTRMFFDGVGSGSIVLKKFDSDWADPTYKIVRVVIVAFALVVAYPYIPGSDSLAFKGVSVFLGVMFSLGSTSFISNMLAGLAMTYRAIFKVGDIVRIGEVIGRVEVSLHLKLPGDLDLDRAHAIAERVEEAIRNAVPEVEDVRTHLEPLTEAAEAREVAIDAESVERVVRQETGGAPRELRFVRTDDGIVAFLTLALAGDEPLADAHARASVVEERIREAVPEIADVVVHTEP